MPLSPPRRLAHDVTQQPRLAASLAGSRVLFQEHEHLELILNSTPRETELGHLSAEQLPERPPGCRLRKDVFGFTQSFL